MRREWWAGAVTCAVHNWSVGFASEHNNGGWRGLPQGGSAGGLRGCVSNA